jgi:outer membrane protein OmpA-like peptidoglycan-associated protein
MRTLLLIMILTTRASADTERLDALDFTNGAYLVDDGGSYGVGLEDWSAWFLADGSDAAWASPKGRPTGEAFVWELDTTWRLDTLGLNTVGLEEVKYPGISVKTVALYVAPARGGWSSIGTFDIGTGERKEFPLPKGAQAARVKLEIIANHGSKEYSELAEVDLFGARVGRVPTPNIAGTYQLNSFATRIVQDGDRIDGCYDSHGGPAYLWGTISGHVVEATYDEQGTRGAATFQVRNGLTGVWFHANGSLANTWSGPRIADSSTNPACKLQPQRHIGERLEHDGKVVLYGIRFAVDSATPLPESTADLENLAAALAAKPTLRVEIAGHTDASAGDTYNNDLSERRARAIIAWLAGKGIATARLVAKGYGRSRPVADNTTAQGRALNRRVEVTVLP